MTCSSRGTLAAALFTACLVPSAAAQDDWLTWSATTAEAVGKAMRRSGRVGGYFDMRVKSTNKSYNFKLRATWLTPDVIRAGARLIQLQERLSDEETRQLVATAESAADTIVLVELDPREGSGVIPLGWTAHLQPKDRPQGPVVKGSSMPQLRDVPALKGWRSGTTDMTCFGWVSRWNAMDGRSSDRRTTKPSSLFASRARRAASPGRSRPRSGLVGPLHRQERPGQMRA